jgi:hypothetical protein
MGVVLLNAPATQWPVDREGRIVLGQGSPVDLNVFHVETRRCFSIGALVTSAKKDGRTLFLYPNGHSPYWKEEHVHSGEWVTVNRQVRCFTAKTTEGSKHINDGPSGSDRRLLLAM